VPAVTLENICTSTFIAGVYLLFFCVFASKIKVAVGVVGSGQAVQRPGQMLHMYELGIEQGCELFLHCTCI